MALRLHALGYIDVDDQGDELSGSADFFLGQGERGRRGQRSKLSPEELDLRVDRWLQS